MFVLVFFFFFKQKTAYEMRISDWSSDVCSSDLVDFADTDNAASRHLDIGKGSTSGVSAVSAGGRTRVVVELMRESSYRSRIDGNSLVLTVNNGSTDQSVTTAAMVDPTKALPSSSKDRKSTRLNSSH